MNTGGPVRAAHRALHVLRKIASLVWWAPIVQRVRRIAGWLALFLLLQMAFWWALAIILMASPSSVSPATGRWLWASVRASSASTSASPGSDLAPEVEWRSR